MDGFRGPRRALGEVEDQQQQAVCAVADREDLLTPDLQCLVPQFAQPGTVRRVAISENAQVTKTKDAAKFLAHSVNAQLLAKAVFSMPGFG